MRKREIINKTKEFVKEKLGDDRSGHDYYHIKRVWGIGKLLGKKEGGDSFIIQLGCLLHDIADWKFSNGDLHASGEVTDKFLSELGVDRETIEAIKHIVNNVSYKGAGVKNKMKSLEGKIVQDADRLDALGAMGIARAMVYSGHAKQAIYDPSEEYTLHKTFLQYKKAKSSAIGHFHEKLLLMKDRMNTKTAKRVAASRHNYMLNYEKRFLDEWNLLDVKRRIGNSSKK